MNLYEHQIQILQEIEATLELENHIFVQMPTGTGKTVVIAELIRRILRNQKENRRILIIVHRKELIEQTRKHLYNNGIQAGQITAGSTEFVDNLVIIGMVQTLARSEDKRPKNVGTVIIDEAHHTPSSSYKTILGTYHFNKLKLIGFSATPERLDKKPLSDIYTKLISGQQISWYIENGYLAKTKHFATSFPELEDIKIDPLTHDFERSELAQRMRDTKIIADTVLSYKNHTPDKKAIVFAVNSAHAEDIKSRFIEEGIKAQIILSKTNAQERSSILDQFKIGKCKVLINVAIFTEGFDSPDIEAVILARPTKSLSLYLQMIGRVTRYNPGKTHGIILDNASNWLEHGLITTERFWTLNGIKKTVKKQITSIEKLNETQLALPNELLNVELVEIALPVEIEDNDMLMHFESIEKTKDYPSLTSIEKAIFFKMIFKKGILDMLLDIGNRKMDLNHNYPLYNIANVNPVKLKTMLSMLGISYSGTKIGTKQLLSLISKFESTSTADLITVYNKELNVGHLQTALVSIEDKLNKAIEIETQNELISHKNQEKNIELYLNKKPIMRICSFLFKAQLKETTPYKYGSEIQEKTGLPQDTLDELFRKYFKVPFSFSGKYTISELLTTAELYIPYMKDTLIKISSIK